MAVHRMVREEPRENAFNEDRLALRRDIQEMFQNNLPEDNLNLAVFALTKEDDLTRECFSRIFGRILIGRYDWAVILLMLTLGILLDWTSFIHNTRDGKTEAALGAFDTAYLGLSSSLIILASQIDNWFKSHHLGADAAIGAVIALVKLFESIKIAYAGRLHIQLPQWVFAFFMFVLLFMTKEHVSDLTAILLLVNLSINCVLMGAYYLIPLMIGVLLYIRGDGGWIKAFLGNKESMVKYLFAGMLFIVFVSGLKGMR